MDINYNELGLSSYKRFQSKIEFKTTQNTELFTTKKENIKGLLIVFIPILTFLAPMIWAIHNGHNLLTNIMIISIISIIGMILEYNLVSSLDSPTNIKKVKITISPNGLEIDSKKRGKITTDSYNIKTIYIDSEESKLNSNSNSTESKSTYTVICKLHKPITVPINKRNIKKIQLFENFEGEKNLQTAKNLIAELKKILNIRENFTVAEEKYFETENIIFEKNKNEIKINTSATDGLVYNGNMFDTTDILFTIILIISIFWGVIISDTPTNIIKVIIAIISYISFYIIYKSNINPKNIIYTITPNEIKITTNKKKSLTINKENINYIYIDRIKEWIPKGKNEGYYVNYDNIIISLKRQISLSPINSSTRNKINMFGNIKLVNSDYSIIIKDEIKKMLQK